MKKAAPFIVIGLPTLTFWWLMRIWKQHADAIQARYILDYIRYTLGVPDSTLWHYRIVSVQHLPISEVPGIYGQPLWWVLLYPILGAAFALILALVIVGMFPGSTQGNVLRGPRVICNMQWVMRMWGSKKGFYIQQ